METRRPQLSLDELHQLRWLLGNLLALISIGTVVYLEINAWVLAGAATAVVLASLVRPALPAYMPPWVHKLAFPFIVVFFVWDLYSSGEVLPAMIRLDLLLLLYRGGSYRKKRDDLQIVVLGLFVVMIAGVLTVSLTFAVQILVFTAVTLAFLFVITLVEGIEGEAAAVPATAAAWGAAGVPAWARVRWGRLARRVRAVADWRLFALGGGLFLGVVAVSALLFMAIPRFQLESSFFLERFMTKKSRTGFSDTIRLGDVVDIQQDNSVALRVDVSDPARVPAEPYWRMVVLDEYQNGTLRTSRRLQNELLISAQQAPYAMGPARPPRAASVFWTFYFESGVSRHLPLAGSFYLLRFREPQWFQQQNMLLMVALRNEPVAMTAYRVDGMTTDGFIPDRRFAGMLRAAESAAAPGPGAERAAAGPGYPLTTLGLPDRPDDRADLQRAVAAITGGARLSAADFSARAAQWLVDRHHYSLQVDLPKTDRDPIVAWMDSGLPGHCELFTGAFTLLARAAGCPTRVVTGFRGGDWNAYENYFMVRNSHAHAWCEVYDGSTGWFRVDPTAGAGAITSGPQNPAGGAANLQNADRSWGARLDAIRILWYRRIVNFDQRTQLALVQSLRDATNDLGAALRFSFDRAWLSVRAWLRRPWDVRRLLTWAGVFAGAAVAVELWRRAGRTWWWRLRGTHRHGRADPVRRRAGRLLKKLAETRGSGVEGRKAVADLQRLRYGPRVTWPEPAAVFRRARRALRSERRAARHASGAVAAREP